MKKIVSLLLVLMLAVGMVGCGNSSDSSDTAATSAAQESDNKDAVVVDTTILKEADDDMLNTYTVIAVNPDAPFVDANGNAVSDVAINTAGADALIQWLLTDEALDLAANYGYDDYGEYLFYREDNAPVYSGDIAKATDDTKTIRLSTTTSVNDSGLLDYLLPIFEDEYGYTVEVTSAGTGQAIAAAENGNADLILVHSKSQEEEFVNAGYARVVDGFDTERLSFLYNYFVLCGPSDDPAGVADAATVKDAFAAIAEGEYPFISRGDESGTHTKELSLWPADLGITADPASFADYTSWYTSANAGMGACLVMAEEKGAYILTDKATYLTFVANGGQVE
ncbi:MAG: substrate-binding domain-containing protein [Peptococcaceae bacterium]|nr:substrate-binding domain-containing protein [Peptococcaceae bacterium]